MFDENSMREGLELYEKGEYLAALSYFLSLPEDFEADAVDIAYYIGLCYTKLQRYDDALIYLEQVVTAEDDDAYTDEGHVARVLQCRHILAVIYCNSGRKNLAEFEFSKLLDVGYKPSSVYSSMAYMAWEEGRIPLCLSYYEKALSKDEENPTALNGIGYVLACEGTDLTRALTCCKKAYKILPENPAVLDSLGWVYYKLGLFTDARKYLEMASKLDGSNKIITEHLRKVHEDEK